MGENNLSAGIPLVSYAIPYLSDEGGGNTAEVGSYADYFGLPTNKPIFGGNYGDKITALPFRGLAKIYNRWFRNENLIAPLAVQTGDANEALVGEANTEGGITFPIKKASVLKASKLPDYFTTALPYAQKGTAVSIPLGTTAPIITGSLHSTGSTIYFGNNSGLGGISHGLFIDDAGRLYADGNEYTGAETNFQMNRTNLVADLSSATAATINQLRYAFQLQKLLEKDALYGSRYWEILSAHFGVQSPDASLQDPEYLGGKRMHINIDQVLSQSGYAPDDSTTVGAPGANSVSGFKGSIFTKSFTEHGYLFIIAVARHDQTYGQGIERMWTRKSRYDFYFPVFANLGAQDVKLRELYATGESGDDTIFGYQEAWAEYRYKKSLVSSALNPVNSGAMPWWTLATRFGSAPTLGKTFIEQDRTALAAALVSGNDGPDFICDFMFRDIAVRPMPVYSIPGLIDHH